MWLATVTAINGESDWAGVCGDTKANALPARLSKGLSEHPVEAASIGFAFGRGWGILFGHRSACYLIDHVVRPLVGDGECREDDEEKWDGRPEADGVVPIEIAGFDGEVGAEPYNWPEVLPGPDAWHPEVEAGENEQEECESAGTGDGAAGCFPFALPREPSVPATEALEEFSCGFVGAAEDLGAVWVEVDDAFAARVELYGFLRVRAEGDGGGCFEWSETEEIFNGERRDAGRGDLEGTAICAGNDLTLIGEEDSRKRHQEDNEAAQATDNEMEPK